MVRGKRCHSKRSRSYLYQNFKQENAIEEETELDNDTESIPSCITPKIQEETVTPNNLHATTDSALTKPGVPPEREKLVRDRSYRSSLREKIILRRIINLTERKSDFLLLNGPLYIKKSSLNLLDYQLDSVPLEKIFDVATPGQDADDTTEAEPYFLPFDRKLTDENIFLSLTESRENFETNARNADILFYHFIPRESDKMSQNKELPDEPTPNDTFEDELPDRPSWMQFQPPQMSSTGPSMQLKLPTVEFETPIVEYKIPSMGYNPPTTAYRRTTMEYTPPTMEYIPPTMEYKLPNMEYNPPPPDYQTLTYNLPTQSQCSCPGGTCDPNCVVDAPAQYGPTNQCSPDCIHNPTPKLHFKPQPCPSQCSPDCKFNPQRIYQQKPCIPKCNPKCQPKPKCCCAISIDNCNQYYPECKPKPKCTYTKPIVSNPCSPCKPKPKCTYAKPIENCCNQYYPDCKPQPNCSYATPVENCCNQCYPGCSPKPKCCYNRPVDKFTQCYSECTPKTKVYSKCIPKPKCSQAQLIANCHQHYPDCIPKPTCSHAKPVVNCNQFYPDFPPKPNNKMNPQNNTRKDCSPECKLNNTQPIYYFLNEAIYKCNSEGEICSTSSDTMCDSKPGVARDYQIIQNPFHRQHDNMCYFKGLSAINYDTECSKYKSYIENMFFPPLRSIPTNHRAVNIQPIYCSFDPNANNFSPENEDKGDTTIDRCNSDRSFKMQTKYSGNISADLRGSAFSNKAEVRFQPNPQNTYLPEYDINVQDASDEQCSSKCTISTKPKCSCNHQINSRCSPECNVNVQDEFTMKCIFNAQPKCNCGIQIEGTCSPECGINVEASTNQYSSECTCNTQAKCTCGQLNGTCSPECIINIQGDTANQCSSDCTVNTNPKCTCGELNGTCSPECNIYNQNETTNQCSSICTFNKQPKCTCCIMINDGCSPECDINMQDDSINFCNSECLFNIQPQCTCQHHADGRCSPECDINEDGLEGTLDPNLQEIYMSQCTSDCPFNLQPICLCGRLVLGSKSSQQNDACESHVEGTNLQETPTKPCTSDCGINPQPNCTCGSTHKCSSECNINALKKKDSSKFSLKIQPKFIFESKMPKCRINESNVEGEDISPSESKQSERQLNQKCSSNCETILAHVNSMQDAPPSQEMPKCQVMKQSKYVCADLPIPKCISHEYSYKNVECPLNKQPKCSCGEEYECSSECDSKWKNGKAFGADECDPDSNIDNTKSKKNLDNEALRICRRCCERNKQVIQITRDKENIPEQPDRRPIDEEEKLLQSCLLCCKQAKCVGTSSESSYRKCGIQCSFCRESSKPRSANPLDITDSEAEFLINSYVPQKKCDFTLSQCQMKRTHGEKYGDAKYHFLMVDISTEKNHVVDSSTSSSIIKLHDELAERRAVKAEKIRSKQALEANKKLLEIKSNLDEKKHKEHMEPIPEISEAQTPDTVSKNLTQVLGSEQTFSQEFISSRTKELDQKPTLFEAIITQEKKKLKNDYTEPELKYQQFSEKDLKQKNTDWDRTDRDSKGWFSFLRTKKRHGRSMTSTVSQKISLIDEDDVEDEGSDISVSQLEDQMHKENENKSLDSYRRRISPIEKPVSEKDNNLNRYLNNLNIPL